MRLIEDHILRNVHGNVVLAPVSDRETDFQGMIVLNPSGELEPEAVMADLDAFLADLDSCRMLVY